MLKFCALKSWKDASTLRHKPDAARTKRINGLVSWKLFAIEARQKPLSALRSKDQLTPRSRRCVRRKQNNLNASGKPKPGYRNSIGLPGRLRSKPCDRSPTQLRWSVALRSNPWTHHG